MDTIQKYVESKGCQFISGEITTGKNLRMKIISTCGHESNVFYSNFKVKSSGIICSSCRIKVNSANSIESSKLNSNYDIENDGIQMIQKLLNNLFDFEKTREGALADFIIKVKSVISDTWYGIQLKTISKINNVKQYGFRLNQKNYTNCILLLNVLDEERIWYIPSEISIPKAQINIGSTAASKYAQYEIQKVRLANHLQSIFYQYTPHPKSHWNKSTVCCNLEDHFIQIRKEKFAFLKYKEPLRNSLPYDFTVNGFKVQEKSISIDERKKKTMTFTLKKSNGTTKKVRKFKAYDIDDNDFYWLWCKESDFFYIIPQDILVEQNIIGPTGRGNLTIPKKGALQWIQPYTFDINNIDEKTIKSFSQ